MRKKNGTVETIVEAVHDSAQRRSAKFYAMPTKAPQPESTDLPRPHTGEMVIVDGRFRADGPTKAALWALAIHHFRAILIAMTFAAASAYGWHVAKQLGSAVEFPVDFERQTGPFSLASVRRTPVVPSQRADRARSVDQTLDE
jgi:hypothetical protein